ICGAALETLGDIVGDRESRPFQLVPEPRMAAERLKVHKFVNHASQLRSILPNRVGLQSACTAYPLRGISNFKSQIKPSFQETFSLLSEPPALAQSKDSHLPALAPPLYHSLQ